MIELTIPEHGGPVHPTGLKRREGKLVTLPCGCQSDDSRWLALCDNVHQELLRIRQMCAADRLPTLHQQLEKELTT